MANEKELHVLEGVVVRKFPPEFGANPQGRKWVKNKFVIKTSEGRDLYVSTFGKFDANLIGQAVKFKATKFNDTNYTVQGEIGNGQVSIPAASTAVAVAEPETANEEPVAKRGRPRKVADAPAAPSLPVEAPVAKVTGSVSNDEAVQIVKENLLAAVRLAQEINLTNINLVDLGDMIGRTRVALRIEASKDRRMESFKR